MIHLTRLGGAPFVLNAELIREIEATPDTIISLVSGEKIMVRESVDGVVAAVLEYRRQIQPGTCTGRGRNV
ncbi:MAG TPA: flagellar FlbD family protein [Candidatus Hydrogenedentes bacterium]|nr:flagellar FlbD family protein [Candidatus Hydrogenedentota bacterium]HPG67902.1 flagellar FlbD family protein [Candidatus Hydrogenedentota bacterium]